MSPNSNTDTLHHRPMLSSRCVPLAEDIDIGTVNTALTRDMSVRTLDRDGDERTQRKQNWWYTCKRMVKAYSDLNKQTKLR